MKKAEKKLNQIINSLSLNTLVKCKELVNDYRKLKELLYSPFPQESLVEIIRQLKTNSFYQEFKLEADPLFLKTIIIKISDYKIIEELQFSNINYSPQEEHFLDNRIDILASIFYLEQELLELKESQDKLDEKEQEDSKEDNFFGIYLEDIEKLKKMLCSEFTSLSNIEWFLKSDLFEFILNINDCSDVEPINIYQALLENTEILTKKEFIQHKELLGKVEKEYFEYEAFYHVLRNSPAISKSIVFHIHIDEKFSTVKRISPIAKQAFFNNLLKHEDDFHLIKFKR